MAEMKKQPQQASREAELTLFGTNANSLRLLAETIPQIVWTANPDGQHDYYNPRWFAYTGLTFEQTEGWGWLSALHPDDVRDCLTCWNEALRNGEPYEAEFRLKRASDNTYRWHLGKAGVIRNGPGQIVKWVGTCTDIDRQKQTDEELLNVRRQLEASVTQRTKEFEGANLFLKEQILERERVEKNLLKQTKIFASILDSMSEAVIVADADENFLIFNPAAERMFCMGPTPTTASDWSKRYGLFLPDSVTPFPAEQLPLARSSRGEDVDDLEMFVKPPEAPRGLWARVSGRPLRDSSGGPSGGVIVFRDITESKKEDAFRVGQGRILESIAAGVPLKGVLTNLMLLIEAQTEEMVCSVLLLSDDGDHVRHGAAPSLPEHYVRAVDGAPIGPKNGSCGTAMYRGKPVFVTDIFNDPLWEDYRELAAASGLRACWSTPILTRAGKVLGSFAMYYGEPRTPTGTEAKLTDVATHIAGIAIEHQRAEAALQRTQSELAHVSRVTTMGELAASIAHEVNQPLGAIVGNADICLQWLASDQPNLKQLREALEDITNDGRRASEVISRIRSLVKKTAPEK